MTQTPTLLTAIQQLAVDVSKIERSHFRPQSAKRENVAEHSLSVTTLAWFLHQHVDSPTNLDLVLKYSLIHDFVEVHAGDVNTYATPEQRAAKTLHEETALTKLSEEFATFPDMIQTMRAYQTMTSAEARFVWTVDKIQALLLGRLDNWRAYREINISKEQFNAKCAELLSQSAPELKPVFTEIIAWSNETY